MNIINLYNIYVNRLMAAFLIIFPLIFCPSPVEMPRSTGRTITFYGNTFDLFEYYKFLALVIVAVIMLFMLALKVFIIKYPIYISPPLLVFTILVCFSTIFSINPLLSVFGLATKWQGLVTYICYFIVFTFVYNTFRKKDIEKYIIYLLIPSSLVGILSILSFYNKDLIHDFIAILEINYDPNLVKAPIGNRISLGAYFSLLFPISFFALIYYKKNTPIYLITTLLSFCGLMVSQSRTAWVGVLLGISILLIKEFKGSLTKIKTIAPILAIMILAIIVIDVTGGHKLYERILNFKTQVKATIKSHDLSTFGSGRGFIYIRAFKAIKENPLLGTGPDCYMYYGILYPEDYKKYPVWRNTTILTKAHSEYLEIMSTLGIPAFLTYVFFLIQICFIIIKRPKNYSKLWLAMFAGFFSYIIQAAANIGVIAVLPSFFCICAIISRYYSPSRNSIIWKLKVFKIEPYKKKRI